MGKATTAPQQVPRTEWVKALDGALLQTLGAMVRNTAASQQLPPEQAQQLVRERAVAMLDVLGTVTGA